MMPPAIFLHNPSFVNECHINSGILNICMILPLRYNLLWVEWCLGMLKEVFIQKALRLIKNTFVDF